MFILCQVLKVYFISESWQKTFKSQAGTNHRGIDLIMAGKYPGGVVETS